MLDLRSRIGSAVDYADLRSMIDSLVVDCA